MVSKQDEIFRSENSFYGFLEKSIWWPDYFKNRIPIQINFTIIYPRIKLQEHQVKDGLALNFFLEILSTLKAEKGSAAVTTTIKKSGLDSRLMEFFPPINQQQTEENFAKTFKDKNLGEVVNFRKQYAAEQNRNVVYKLIKEAIEEEKTPKEIIIDIKDINDKNNISEQVNLPLDFWRQI